MNIERFFRETGWNVSYEGDQVLIHKGNTVEKLHYRRALELALLLTVRARESKAFMGDTSKQWTSLLQLTDAEQDALEAQRNRRTTGILVPREARVVARAANQIYGNTK